MHAQLGDAYTIDTDGRVWSAHKQGYLNPSTNDSGYHFYTIYINGEQKSVLPHIEVWRQFRGELPKGGIKHADGNKQNNSLDNLIPRHPHEQYVEYLKRGVSITKVAKYFGLPKKEISIRVAEVYPGGIRELRKKHPLNRSINIT